MSDLYSLQGAFYTAIRNTTTGAPGVRTWLGNASEATLALEVDKSDKFESFSGSRGLYGSLVKSKSATLNLTLDEFLPSNIGLALHSTAVPVTAGSVVDELLPTGLVVGNEVQVDKRFISTVVVKDSAGSPATLAAGTDYEVVSATNGIIKILNLGSYVQPFKVSYAYAAATNLALFSNVTPPERWVMFDGINTVTGKKIVLDLFRVQFDPVADFSLINEDWGGLQMSGSVLIDSINLLDSNMGGYGRMVITDA